MIPVVWFEPSCWDQAMVRQLLSSALGATTHQFEHLTAADAMLRQLDGAVVVVPARYTTPALVNDAIAGLGWCVLFLVSDEESTFDHTAITHPNARLWIMTPRPGQHDPADARFIGEGWAPHLPALVARWNEPVRRNDWCFAGQVNHSRRRQLVGILQDLRTPGRLHQSPGFTQGLDHDTYARLLTQTKVVPCPSGPATPDSFRAYEALEAGCIPVVDAVCPAHPVDGYWRLLFGEAPPFPIVNDWTELPALLPQLLDGWQGRANRVQSWWQQYKRRLAVDLDTDLAAVGVRTVSDAITVLMPTSSIPSHPSTDVIELTIDSVRAQLPDAEILVLVDGLRPEHADRRAVYDEYTRRLLWLAAHRWSNVVPIVHDEHLHQGLMTRRALDLVRTPTVLFVEHDTPLLGDIPWNRLYAAVLSGDANVVRLHHEASILNPHRHLMLDPSPVNVAGASMVRTAQWSQRPHLASTAFYRHITSRYFGVESRTMIEDVMHGVLHNAWRTNGEDGWDEFRVWLYAPDGDMKRSTHLDGRGADPKFDDQFIYAYDHGIPPGAPYPTKLRVHA